MADVYICGFFLAGRDDDREDAEQKRHHGDEVGQLRGEEKEARDAPGNSRSLSAA